MPYLLVLPFAVAGVRRLWRSPHRPTALLLLAASSVLVGLVFFPQERFRIPVIDPADHRRRRRAGRPFRIVNTPPNVLVVVPTYNERDNLPLLVRGVLAHDGFRMLIVDDGSPDGTGALADELAAEYPGRIEVMHRTGQRGLGPLVHRRPAEGDRAA